jgi:hypothetical protein
MARSPALMSRSAAVPEVPIADESEILSFRVSPHPTANAAASATESNPSGFILASSKT